MSKADQSPNPTVLITGANRGLGFEIAWQLAHRNCRLILTGRDCADLKRAEEEIRSTDAHVSIATMDVSSSKSIHFAYQSIREEYDRVDVLVNNAGIFLDESRSLLSTSEADIMNILETNAIGPLFIARTFLPLISEGGRIINISSGAGQLVNGVNSYAPAYSVSKSLLNVITIHLARELGPKSISVNAVCPGWVRTDMGGRNAARSVEKGAETPVWLALDAPSKLTGKLLRDKREVPW